VFLHQAFFYAHPKYFEVPLLWGITSCSGTFQNCESSLVGKA